MSGKPIYIHTPDAHNTRAATVVAPILLEQYRPRSILDVGCGIGTWLEVFRKLHGELELQGIDGLHLDLSQLTIPRELVELRDLRQPFTLNRRFDMVISLEVAEHLPESSARDFVESLTRHSDLIIFSAAIPGQGGFNHLNEQWPTYWISLFNSFGYQVYDSLRPLIWDKPEVDAWYKQNILVFQRNDFPDETQRALDMVHPEYWRHQGQTLITYETLITRIRAGKTGWRFALKVLANTILNLGVKRP